MREYKFRGKRIDNGEWVYGYYYTQIITHAGNRKSRDHFIRTEQNIRYEVDPETVGQYTGKPDKNSKEIYDGDIIDCSYTNPMSQKIVKRLYEVIYEDGCFKAKCIGHSPYGDTLLYFVNEKGVVIGNIYDNPELLKEGE